MQWTMVNAETHNWSKVIVESSVSDGLSVAHPCLKVQGPFKKGYKSQRSGVPEWNTVIWT